MTNSPDTVYTGDYPWAICANPNMNKIYVANRDGNDVTVIEEVAVYTSPLASSITPLTGNETVDALPSFTGTSVNSRSPNNCNIMKVLYQFETTQGEWEEATITSGGGTSSVNWEATTSSPLISGFHSLYVVALDSTSGTINMTENFTGGITPYYFLAKTSITGIDIHDDSQNRRLMLSSGKPNPFINSTIITYRIPGNSGAKHVRLNVYNICGALIKELVNEEHVPGTYIAEWDGMNFKGTKVPCGVYIYNLEIDDMRISSKGIVVR